MRMIGGVVAGLIVAFLCVYGIETIGHSLYPPPPGFDLSNPDDMARMIAVMPVGAKVAVVLGWFVGALVGALVADKIARRGLAGWIVAILVVAAGIATMVMIPHPAWMWVAGIGLPLLAAWLAQRLARVGF
jgi:hypothetical protein